MASGHRDGAMGHPKRRIVETHNEEADAAAADEAEVAEEEDFQGKDQRTLSIQNILEETPRLVT
jgi:hypothetical protein